jgi:hypothetical protein
MALAVANLGPIVLGTEQSLKLRANGQSVSAIGDGRLEPEIADKFHSSSAVQSVDDSRIKNLQTDIYTLMKLEYRPEYEPTEEFETRQAKIKELKDAGKGDWKSLVNRHLGEKWTITDTDRRAGGAYGSLTASLVEGDASLAITVKRFSNCEGVALGGNWKRGDFTVHQSVNKDTETGKIQEFMSLVDTRVKPEPVYILQPMI